MADSSVDMNGDNDDKSDNQQPMGEIADIDIDVGSKGKDVLNEY